MKRCNKKRLNKLKQKYSVSKTKLTLNKTGKHKTF